MTSLNNSVTIGLRYAIAKGFHDKGAAFPGMHQAAVSPMSEVAKDSVKRPPENPKRCDSSGTANCLIVKSPCDGEYQTHDHQYQPKAEAYCVHRVLMNFETR